MSLLTEVKGWTPVIDALTKEHGLITAAVFGAVWRYCQMDDRVCRASLEVIAEHLGIGKATVMRHIKILCDEGYLKDLTPTRRNAPHVYADTGKIKIVSNIEATEPKKGLTKRQQTVSERNSLEYAESQTVSERNATVSERNATVSESHLKKDSKRLSKKQRGGEMPAPIPAYKVFVDTTGCNGIHKTWIGKIAEAVGEQPADLDLWKTIIIAWLGLGWKKTNVSGMLDYFNRGEIPGEDKKGATNGRNPNVTKTKSNISGLGKSGEGLDAKPTFNPYTGKTVMP